MTTSVADVAAFNPNNTKKLLANGLSTFFIKSKTVSSNNPRGLSTNPPNCTILENQDF